MNGKWKKPGLIATGALTAALVLGGVSVAYAVDDAEGERAGIAGVLGRAGGGLLGVVADLTGLDVDDVAERRADGESFATIAESEGVSTDDVKGAAVEQYESSLDERLNSTEAIKGPRGRGGMGAHPAEVLAGMTDLEMEEIREAREAGQSLAQIAEGAGVSADDLITATMEQAEEGLAQAVEDGKMDQDRADEILENMAERLDEAVNSTEIPERGGRGPGGPGGPGGPEGADAEGDAS
jgi:uncharacterized protein (DUF433 family)